jgi:hypothetical protein
VTATAASDPAVELELVGRMIGRSVEHIPGLAGLTPWRLWMGFRAATPENYR